MGKKTKKRNPTRKEKMAGRVSTKSINVHGKAYTLDVYPSKDFPGVFQTVLTKGDQGVCFKGDNYPTIGDAINSTKFEYLGIDY